MEKTIDNIGVLSSPILVFGGVYSNLHALEEMKKIANDLRITPEHTICTGDVVGYCADPEQCVQSIKDWGIHTIAGNVEIQIREGKDDCGCDFSTGSRCDQFSQNWYPFAKSKLSSDSIQWMEGLPEHIRFKMGGIKVTVVHGSYFKTSEFIFGSTDWEIKERNFDKSGAQVILAGHSGLPFSHVKNGKKWLNSGVIGMPPNDGSPKVWYMLLKIDTEGELCYSHHSFSYDYEGAALRMEKNQLPASYANTLRTGIWDNTEILPMKETLASGVRLSP